MILLPPLLWSAEREASIKVQGLERVETIKGEAIRPVRFYTPQKSLDIMVDSDNWQLIPAGQFSGVRFNTKEEKLSKIPVKCEIVSDSVFLAIKSSPKWLQPELFDNFRRLSKSYRSIFARRILESEPKYRDEVAFQVAHLSPHTLQRVDPALLDTNVIQLYRVDPDLRYVDIVEYGDPDIGEWYTTTRYRVIDGNGDTVWAEIPKEIYYWWVLMPKLSDEEPKMDYTVYNKFWRDYLYNYADPGYPLLRDKIKDIEVLWDGKPHSWESERPFSDTMLAVDCVANWVNYTIPSIDVGSRRYRQPNNIAHTHVGRCGELQDLLNAASRTCLMPVLSVCCYPGDHVWNEIYSPLDSTWNEYQCSWGGHNEKKPGPAEIGKGHPSKYSIFGFRADGYTWLVDNHYHTDPCTLTVWVKDAQGNPVDGAEINLWANLYNDPSQVFPGSYWGYTDRDGKIDLILAPSHIYTLRMDTPRDHQPANPTQSYLVLDSTQSLPGGHFEYTFNALDTLKSLSVAERQNPAQGSYKLLITYKVPLRVLYGNKFWRYTRYPWVQDYYDFSDFRSPGDIDFFICDEENYKKYLADSFFEAYTVRKSFSSDSLEFILPEDKDFYILFSNDKRMTISELLYAKVLLYKKTETGWTLIDSCAPDSIYGIEEKPEVVCKISLRVSPNPLAHSPIRFSYSLPNTLRPITLSIYDITGRRLKDFSCINPGSGVIIWDQRDDKGRRVREGIYFARLTSGAYSAVEKLVIIKR